MPRGLLHRRKTHPHVAEPLNDEELLKLKLLGEARFCRSNDAHPEIYICSESEVVCVKYMQ